MRRFFIYKNAVFYFLFFLIILSVFLVSCSGKISKKEAEEKAIFSIMQVVKPYFGNQSTEIINFDTIINNSTCINNVWFVSIRISASVNGTIVKNDVVVKINATNGNFIGIDGKGVQMIKR